MMLLYSIHDSKSEAFSPLMSYQARGQAVRDFADQVNNPEIKTLFNHPEDYTLYEVGRFNESEGVVESYTEIVNLGAGSSYKQGPKGVR